MPSRSLRPHQTALLIAGLASAAAWAVPTLRSLLLPLLYLNTHLHELCHALAAQMTGGDVLMILVRADGSGITPVRGGGLLLLASSGYVGASLAGAAMIFYGRTPNGAKVVLRTLAIALGLSMLLYVRGDIVGVVSGFAWIGGLWALSTFLRDRALLFAAQFLGLQQCLNSLQSVYVLMRLSALGAEHSDAALMARVSHIPAIVWAIAWCALSVIAVGLSVRAAWSRETRPGG